MSGWTELQSCVGIKDCEGSIVLKGVGEARSSTADECKRHCAETEGVKAVSYTHLTLPTKA